MGFSSYDCLGCGHPMLSTYVTNIINKWMNKVVCMTDKGAAAMGYYDGYSRVLVDHNSEGAEIHDGASWWHHACWKKAGKPEFTKPSRYSKDQGYFFNDPTHDMEEPK